MIRLLGCVLITVALLLDMLLLALERLSDAGVDR